MRFLKTEFVLKEVSDFCIQHNPNLNERVLILYTVLIKQLLSADRESGREDQTVTDSLSAHPGCSIAAGQVGDAVI